MSLFTSRSNNASSIVQLRINTLKQASLFQNKDLSQQKATILERINPVLDMYIIENEQELQTACHNNSILLTHEDLQILSKTGLFKSNTTKMLEQIYAANRLLRQGLYLSQPETIKMAIEKGANVNARDPLTFDSHLEFAIKNLNFYAISQLVAYKVDANAVNPQNAQTPLQLIMGFHFEKKINRPADNIFESMFRIIQPKKIRVKCNDIEEKLAILFWLVLAGADVNTTNPHGASILSYAFGKLSTDEFNYFRPEINWTSLAKILIIKGADTHGFSFKQLDNKIENFFNQEILREQQFGFTITNNSKAEKLTPLVNTIVKAANFAREIPKLGKACATHITAHAAHTVTFGFSLSSIDQLIGEYSSPQNTVIDSYSDAILLFKTALGKKESNIPVFSLLEEFFNTFAEDISSSSNDIVRVKEHLKLLNEDYINFEKSIRGSLRDYWSNNSL